MWGVFVHSRLIRDITLPSPLSQGYPPQSPMSVPEISRAVATNLFFFGYVWDSWCTNHASVNRRQRGKKWNRRLFELFGHRLRTGNLWDFLLSLFNRSQFIGLLPPGQRSGKLNAPICIVFLQSGSFRKKSSWRLEYVFCFCSLSKCQTWNCLTVSHFKHVLICGANVG